MAWPDGLNSCCRGSSLRGSSGVHGSLGLVSCRPASGLPNGASQARPPPPGARISSPRSRPAPCRTGSRAARGRPHPPCPPRPPRTLPSCRAARRSAARSPRAQLGEHGLQLGQRGGELRKVPDEGDLSVGDVAKDRAVRHAWARLATQLLGEQHPGSRSMPGLFVEELPDVFVCVGGHRGYGSDGRTHALQHGEGLVVRVDPQRAAQLCQRKLDEVSMRARDLQLDLTPPQLEQQLDEQRVLEATLGWVLVPRQGWARLLRIRIQTQIEPPVENTTCN
eukprot:scaffold11460_cov64-Phaeocystis_antarctica.AAC.14